MPIVDHVDRLARTKFFTDGMLDWVRGKGKILIVVHDNPDPDCLASALALRHIFLMKLNADAVIVFSGMIGRSENIAMAKELEIPITPLGIVNLDEFQVVCMLDTQPGTGNNSFPPGKRVDILIDHHPIRAASSQCRWVDIRDEYGVTATILYEYLVVQDVYISTRIATALFYAIKSETQDLGREANPTDREAYLKLFPLSNKKLLCQITHPQLPREYFFAISRALNNSTIYKSLLISNLQNVSFPEVIAEMADLLVRFEGADTVLCLGRYSNDLILSMRTERSDLNLGTLIRKIVGERGLAGGHGMSAGGKIDNVTSDEEALRVEKELTSRLLTELGMEGVLPTQLIAEVQD